MPIIYGIGHGAKRIELFIEQLKDSEIDVLVDVRSSPKSKWQPQHDLANLSRELEAAGIMYEWRGQTLGGLWRKGSPREALNEIDVWTKMGYKVAVMCSETDHKNCHRAMAGGKMALQPVFEEMGLTMEHIGEPPRKEKPVNLQPSMI